MAQPAVSMFETDTTGPVVRRSWKLAPGPTGPVLTGLFGFTWRHAVVQAKCTAEPWHLSVPSPGCTCGIYATDDPRLGRLERHVLRDSVITSGFVRLSGRVVLSGTTYRAEQAEIVGPLTVALPSPTYLRRWGVRWGLPQSIRWVAEDGDRWLFGYRGRGRGVSIGEWYRHVGEAMRRRYQAEVVGLVPSIPGLNR